MFFISKYYLQKQKLNKLEQEIINIQSKLLRIEYEHINLLKKMAVQFDMRITNLEHVLKNKKATLNDNVITSF